jgi:hypothetical protein
MSTILTVAKGYTKRGWRVFPLDGKKPYPGTHGLTDASSDADQVAAWWQQHPEANVGVRTGAAPDGSGIWVLDLDSGFDAEARVDAVAAGREYRDTLTVLTGGGGLHLVYQYGPELAAWLQASGLTLPTRNGIGGKGLDVRSDGGYIVAVPSVHPDTGKLYAWDNKAAIAVAPEWLVSMVAKPVEQRRAAPPPPRVEGNGFGAAVLRNAVAKVAASTVGERHHTLLAQARTVGGYIVSAGISLVEAEAALVEAGDGCGKPAQEVRRTVRDGLTFGQREPMAVPDRAERMKATTSTTTSDTKTEQKAEQKAETPTKGKQARDLMSRSLGAVYDNDCTKGQRQDVARELAGSVDLLVEVADSAPAEWAAWATGMDTAGGMSEHMRSLRRAVKAGQEERRKQEREVKQNTRCQATGKQRAALMARLSTTEEGTVKNTYANVVTILKGDPRYTTLRCSTLGNVVELDGKEVEEAPGTASLCEWLRDSYGMDASEVSAKSALYAVAQGRMYSPVVEYLDSVRGKGKGDSVGRLLREGLGITAPTQMQAAMLGRFLISAVARAKSPGCKVDTALILVGEQGAFKSTLFKALFGGWFGDSPIPIGTKDAPINMARVWGYEASEMDDLAKRRSVESVKQFLGSASDLYRPPFARTAILAPRHTVMCGSVNPEGGTGGTAAFLTDSSGSRRFWIITVPANWIIPKAKIEAMRDEVWADALADYEAGERWWFNRDEDKEREEDARQYQVEDVWCSALSEWIDGVLGGAENFTTSDALGALGIDVGRRTAKDATRARSVLVRLGWVEKASPAGFRGLRVWRKA